MSMISEVPWWRFTPRRCYVRAATTEKVPFRERDKGAYLWLHSREGGLKYKTPVTSKLVSGEAVEKPYLGGRQTPFPKNPAFKAVAPVSDAVRERLYAQHCANPELETPRKLANQYHLDIRRVEAILRMKHEEHKLKASVSFALPVTDGNDDGLNRNRAIPQTLTLPQRWKRCSASVKRQCTRCNSPTMPMTRC